MKQFLSVFFLLTLWSCNRNNSEPVIVGTWELVSAKTITKDSVFSSVHPNERMIKIFNQTHFSFLRHDIHKGKDSLAVFVAGGGKYTLKDTNYTEYLEYLNYRDWEGKVFNFTATVKKDTLVIEGVEKIDELGVNHKIIEVYKRL